MGELRFEWNPAKARSNLRRHGVSFSEAASVFLDEHAALIDDPDHSRDEDRFVLLGLSATLRVLLVCHCYRASGNVVRIVSARKADPQERHTYFQRLRS
ncbi:MAG TPA: BrnT family toxin [Thermoanaerobaculia bacterium]|nr:BrnT family toxin [Thermoanaerobaculia bacterium]HQR66502.1 BrnT family toxin [Thermoanaerobaculia bacterium]